MSDDSLNLRASADAVSASDDKDDLVRLPVNETFGKLAAEDSIKKTTEALKENNIDAIVVGSASDAKAEVLRIIPAGVQVLTMTSRTLEAVGLDKEINESGKYDAVLDKLYSMDKETQGREMAALGAAPAWVLGSVHALTEDGQLIIASNTGSQLPAEAYSAEKVIFVVGAQKIVANLDQGFKRINEYSYPLEDVRAQQAYGVRSAVNKILIINKEVVPGRITVVIVREKLGF